VTHEDSEIRQARRLVRECFRGPVVDGRPAGKPPTRWRRRAQRLLVSNGEREEAKLEQLLGQQPTVSRPNVAAVISPKGGVGKTTTAFVVGSLIADRLRLRVVAVDANPDFGTLASLTPEKMRCERTLADLLADIEHVHTAAELRQHVSALPSGLHVLSAPRDPCVMERLGPESYGELLALLSTFYELIILDLGTGVAGQIAQVAISRADQLVLVTTPEWITGSLVLSALEHLEHEHTTVACNKFYARRRGDLRKLERRLHERGLHRSVAIPHNDQLAAMLDSATYQLDALERTSRVAIKRLGLAVAEQLV
jgi:MinD-like ATPase involved in chromosome partitioning or flagellar assembly